MPFSFSSPRLWIVEGLLNKNAWVQDFIVSQTDMIWVAVKKLFVLYSSVWNFDRGKLVILNVFIKFHHFETVEKCHIQVTKVVRKTRNEPCKITTFSVIVSSFKQIFKVSHCYAQAAKMCRALCISFEEGEEDFIPMGMVTLTFCQHSPFSCQWMANFGREMVKEENVARNQRIPILLYLTATLPSHSSNAC